MTSYKMSINCVWLLITGGASSIRYISSPDILNVLELGMRSNQETKHMMPYGYELSL